VIFPELRTSQDWDQCNSCVASLPSSCSHSCSHVVGLFASGWSADGVASWATILLAPGRQAKLVGRVGWALAMRAAAAGGGAAAAHARFRVFRLGQHAATPVVAGPNARHSRQRNGRDRMDSALAGTHRLHQSAARRARGAYAARRRTPAVLALPASAEFALGPELLLIDDDPQSVAVFGRARAGAHRPRARRFQGRQVVRALCLLLGYRVLALTRILGDASQAVTAPGRN